MNKIITISIVSLLLVSCWKKEDPLKKEQKQIKLFFGNSKILTGYKGAKIAIRTDYSDTSAANLKISKSALKNLSAVSNLLITKSSSDHLTIQDICQTVKALYELQKEINAVDEDKLPKISDKLDALQPLTGIAVSSSLTDIFGTYNNSTEHFLFGSIWFIMPAAPAEIYTYEFLKIKNNDLVKPDHIVLACLAKALVCMDNEWYYTSEKNSTECIDYITSHKSECVKSMAYLNEGKSAGTESMFYEMRALAYIIRGYARDNTGRTKEANADFDKFTEDLDKAELKDKDLCFLASYFCVKNSNYKRAETFLNKIEQNENFDSNDKKLVTELREFIKNKEDKKFNRYFDTFSLSKITCVYLYNVWKSSNMTDKLKTNKSTKQLIEMPERINNVINSSEKTLSKDSLLNTADKFVKDLFK